MFEVSKVMKREVLTVRKDASIHDAIKMLVAVNVTGLPVVDDEGKLVGIISEKDIIGLFSDLELLESLHDMNSNPRTVEELMSSDVITFDQDDSLIAVCEFLKGHNIRRVPIVSEGELVGIISRRDIIKYMYELGRAERAKL